MRILFVTDLHGSADHAAALADAEPDVDLLLVGGDITNFGGPSAAAAVLAPLERAFPALRGVHGNVDLADVGGWLRDRGLSLHGRGEVLGEVALRGCGGSNITPLDTPTELPEEEIQALLEEGAAAVAGAAEPSVVVTHVPPVGTKVDLMFLDRHVGSRAVREHLEATEPALCLCGHIHEAVGEDRVGETLVVNPGTFASGRYAAVEIRGDELRCSLHRLELAPGRRARAAVRTVTSKVAGFARHKLRRR